LFALVYRNRYVTKPVTMIKRTVGWPPPGQRIRSSPINMSIREKKNPPLTPSLAGKTETTNDRMRKFNFWRYFWLTFLIVSLAYAWYCFYVPTNNIAWADNYASAQKQATDSGKPIILYFTGTWCVPCRVMKRQVWADEEVKTLINAQFIPLEIDLDNPNDAALIARYKVGGTPVTIITDSHGNALRWRAGGLSKSEFIELLSEPNPSAGNDKS
jgi:protein disulfide-isomerase